MTDFLFVGELFVFVLGMVTMFLGLERLGDIDEYVNAIVFHLIASICFFALGQFFLMSYTSSTVYVLSFWYLFYGLGGINLVIFLVWSVQVFRISSKKKLEEAEQ